MARKGRALDQTREITIKAGFAPRTPSVIFGMGNTVVHCSVSIDDSPPPFVEDGHGWLTAEYSMLPSATHTRSRRERSKVSGRTTEIQRLIGRSLRAAVDLSKVKGHSFYVDCDVLSADGGTRCASISGGFLALVLALRKLEKKGVLKVADVLHGELAAVSVGAVEGQNLLDLEYREDYRADVDMNVVLFGDNRLVEVQGTAEGAAFDRTMLSQFLDLAELGAAQIVTAGRQFLEQA